jgi:hypothetical protein
MAVDPHTDVPDAGTLRALWAGILLPPVAFLLNLEAAYALVPAACSSRNLLPVHLVHAAALGFAILGGATALRFWRQSGSTWPGGEGGRLSRNRFMAGLGVFMGLQFGLVIVAQWIPSFILDPCQ